jgi:hypothetical protein
MQICNIMLVHCNQLFHAVVIAEDEYNDFEASTLGIVYTEYNRILQITPIFSNLHKMWGEKATMAQI